MVHDFYISLRYLEIDAEPDMIRFVIPVPDILPSTLNDIGAELCNAIDDAMETLDYDEYDGCMDWLDAAFRSAAKRMNARTWNYLRVSKYIEV